MNTHLYAVLEEELVVSQGTLQARLQQGLERGQGLGDVHVLDDQVLVLWRRLLAPRQNLLLVHDAVVPKGIKQTMK